MATRWSQQSATFSSPDGGHTLSVQIGPTTWTGMEYEYVKEIALGLNIPIEFVLLQASVFLDQAGTNLNNLASVQALVNSKTYWWNVS
jgi:hypothetical protein